MSKRVFEANSANSLYLDLVHEILNFSEYTSYPRGLKCKETLNVTIRLTDPTKCLVTFKQRKLNNAFAVVEKLEYLSGQTNPERLIFYNSKLKTWCNALGYFDGAYGDRLQYWHRHIHNLLKKDPYTRQAVATIYGPRDRHESKDICCTVSHQYLIRENKLYLTTYMRSQDLLWGFPYDINGFCFLQEALAATLNVGLGSYTLHVGSLHVYAETEDQLANVLANSQISVRKNPTLLKPIDFNALYSNLNLFWYLERGMRLNTLLKENQRTLESQLIPGLQEYFTILHNYKLKKDEKRQKNL